MKSFRVSFEFELLKIGGKIIDLNLLQGGNLILSVLSSTYDFPQLKLPIIVQFTKVYGKYG